MKLEDILIAGAAVIGGVSVGKWLKDRQSRKTSAEPAAEPVEEPGYVSAEPYFEEPESEVMPDVVPAGDQGAPGAESVNYAPREAEGDCIVPVVAHVGEGKDDIRYVTQEQAESISKALENDENAIVISSQDGLIVAHEMTEEETQAFIEEIDRDLAEKQSNEPVVENKPTVLKKLGDIVEVTTSRSPTGKTIKLSTEDAIRLTKESLPDTASADVIKKLKELKRSSGYGKPLSIGEAAAIEKYL